MTETAPPSKSYLIVADIMKLAPVLYNRQCGIMDDGRYTISMTFSENASTPNYTKKGIRDGYRPANFCVFLRNGAGEQMCHGYGGSFAAGARDLLKNMREHAKRKFNDIAKLMPDVGPQPPDPT